jgi:F420-dependent oxidoreductase-like protein
MKFDVKTRPEHITWAQMREIWLAADDIEIFNAAWNWDHFYPLTGDFDGPNLEAWTTLAALAEATKRIRVGVQVTGMIYRHPAVLANMAATVDIISNGRLELGIGAGWNEMETTAYGIELPTLKKRFDQFDEGTQILIGLLRDEHTDFAGEHFTITNARNEPKPVQRPYPPIVIGGSGPKRTLLAVAKWAQQWNAITPDPETWLASKAILLEHCAAVGRDPGEIECSVNVQVPGDGDLGPALEKIAAYGEAGVDIVVLGLPNGAQTSILDDLAAAVAPLA